MRAHRTDFFSLISGVLFLAVVAWWATDRFFSLSLDVYVPHAGWVAAGALILFGLVGVVASLRSERATPPTGPNP